VVPILEEWSYFTSASTCNMGTSIPLVQLYFTKQRTVQLLQVTGPAASRSLRLSEFIDIRYMNVVKSSGLRTGHLYPPGNIAATHFCWKLSRPQGHATGRFKSMRNPMTPSGIEPVTFQACSTVPQPTAPPRILLDVRITYKEQKICNKTYFSV
jgi:hypothetical protein